jgi:hypothetical protein
LEIKEIIFSLSININVRIRSKIPEITRRNDTTIIELNARVDKESLAADESNPRGIPSPFESSSTDTVYMTVNLVFLHIV